MSAYGSVFDGHAGWSSTAENIPTMSLVPPMIMAPQDVASGSLGFPLSMVQDGLAPALSPASSAMLQEAMVWSSRPDALVPSMSCGLGFAQPPSAAVQQLMDPLWALQPSAAAAMDAHLQAAASPSGTAYGQAMCVGSPVWAAEQLALHHQQQQQHLQLQALQAASALSRHPTNAHHQRTPPQALPVPVPQPQPQPRSSRGGSRGGRSVLNKRGSGSGGLVPRAPAWADATWHPMAVMVSSGQIANGGTGVFLPRNSPLAAALAKDKANAAASGALSQMLSGRAHMEEDSCSLGSVLLAPSGGSCASSIGSEQTMDSCIMALGTTPRVA